MQKITIHIENELSFYKSSMESVINFLGPIGSYSEEYNTYDILKGKYEVLFDVQKMVDLTETHSIELSINNGIITLS